jgi:hypothetical protein
MHARHALVGARKMKKDKCGERVKNELMLHR